MSTITTKAFRQPNRAEVSILSQAALLDPKV